MKEIAQLAIFLVFVLPTLLTLTVWTHDISKNPSADNMQKGVEIVAEDAIPWWLGIFVWIASLGGMLSVILLLGLIYFLKWVEEI